MTFVRICPCGCGRKIYTLGMYRGFQLIQKPFFHKHWLVSATKTKMDKIDELILQRNLFPGEFREDTATIAKLTVSEIEKQIKTEIDGFWKEKQELIGIVNTGKLEMEGGRKKDD